MTEEGTDGRLCALKRGILLTAVSAAVTLAAFPAFADDDEDRTPIEEIVLDVSADIEVGDASSDVEVSVDSGECEVGNVDVTNEPSGEWEHKDKPKLKVTLDADSDYYFKSGFSKKKVSLTGDSATLTSVRRKSEEELEVVITLKALKGSDSDYELDVDEAEWDQMNGVAEWNDSEDAKYYELRLYRDSRLITNLRPIYESSCELGSYFTSAGSYYFEVRAVYSDSRKGEWQESDSFDVSAEQAAEILLSASYRIAGTGPASGNWEQAALGYRYRNADQTYTVNNWQQIGGFWYFFDENGYRKTGWIQWNDKWYYLDENGVMLSNTVTPDGKTVGEDGALY